MTNSIDTAKVILNQLGGKRFIMMTGAKNLGATSNGLVFKVMGNAKKVNHVRITLNALDLYDVEYLSITKKAYKTISESKGIYDDMLRKDFETNTGLYTSL